MISEQLDRFIAEVVGRVGQFGQDEAAEKMALRFDGFDGTGLRRFGRHELRAPGWSQLAHPPVYLEMTCRQSKMRGGGRFFAIKTTENRACPEFPGGEKRPAASGGVPRAAGRGRGRGRRSKFRSPNPRPPIAMGGTGDHLDFRGVLPTGILSFWHHRYTVGQLPGDNRMQPAASHIIIPARLASTRLPRKLLLRETGKTLLQHTYEAAARARRPKGICVAADHAEIADAVRAFGGEVQMTDPHAASGTDRVAEAARRLPGVEIVVNVQGDEPELSGALIDLVVGLLEERPAAMMATLATPIRSRRQLQDPACVKVVFDAQGRAIYFSRSPIPCARDWDDALLAADPPHYFQHVGLYAYRREFLLQLAAMPQSSLERIEKLEQLRVLQAGYAILVGVVDEPTFGIDTPEDYRAFVRKYRSAAA